MQIRTESSEVAGGCMLCNRSARIMVEGGKPDYEVVVINGLIRFCRWCAGEMAPRLKELGVRSK